MFAELPDRVRVVEVGPRDGLQYEPDVLSVESRKRFIELLSGAVRGVLEVGSFVRPDRIPQLADTENVLAGLTPPSRLAYQALVPNLRGLERALSTPNIHRIAVFISASESHNKANINRSVADSLAISADVLAAAKEQGLGRRGYLSMSWGSPKEPDMPPSRVAELAGALFEAGCEEVALGDTVGFAVPNRTAEVVRAVKDTVPLSAIALHMHDTRGTALANILAGMEEGVRSFDTAVGGLGGCPFAPGASGNLATEDLVLMLERMGVATDINLDKLLEAAIYVENLLGRRLPSRSLRVLRGPYTPPERTT